MSGPLFAPRSVAVAGASASPAKWGYWLASGALAGRGRRTVHLVNRRGGALSGVPFQPSPAALDSPPEHVVVTSAASGGQDPDGERALAELVTAHGARLLGPNCMGVVDTAAGLSLTWGEFPAGDIGLVSQSGNLALELATPLTSSPG